MLQGCYRTATNKKCEAIRKVAYAIYFESRENGLENDPEGDWLKAERICGSWARWMRWQILWHLKRYPTSIAAVAAFIAVFMNVFTTGWVVYTNSRATDLSNRPYISVNMEDPVRFVKDLDVFYGNPIILRNEGKTPASKVVTSYYITTDLDKKNMNGEEWFDKHMGGFGSVSFLAPGSDNKEPGFRSLSPVASYYYFEALTTYDGLKRDKRYWTHIKKVFLHHAPSGRLYPVFSMGEWDRNLSFNPPQISTEQQVENLLKNIKGKRKQVEQSEQNQPNQQDGSGTPEQKKLIDKFHNG